MAASTMPAAPSVWPVQPFVELQGGRCAEDFAYRAALGVVVRDRAGSMQVDVVDFSGRSVSQRRAHRCDRAAATPPEVDAARDLDALAR